MELRSLFRGWHFGPRGEAAHPGGFHYREPQTLSWSLESLFNDAGDLWCSFKAAREQDDEMGFCTNILSPWDKCLELFAYV